MKFETAVAKYDDHEVYTGVNKFPTLRIFKDAKYALALALHKWNVTEGTNKGFYLACYVLTEYTLWENINIESLHETLEEHIINIQDLDTKNIESCKYTNITVYKFSVNCWRQVENTGKKVLKWGYVDTKPDKNQESCVQRLLKN